MGPDAWTYQKKLGPEMLKSRCLQPMYHGIVQKYCSWYLYGTMVHIQLYHDFSWYDGTNSTCTGPLYIPKHLPKNSQKRWAQMLSHLKKVGPKMLNGGMLNGANDLVA